jgi:anti-anti-sigma factor
LGEIDMASSLYSISDLEFGRVVELSLPAQMDVIQFDDLNVSLISEIDSKPSHYVIDLSRTDYVGSAVLGLLVNLRTRVRKSGKKLVLCRLSPRIIEIFRVGSLESLFVVVGTREAAVQALGRG